MKITHYVNFEGFACFHLSDLLATRVGRKNVFAADDSRRTVRVAKELVDSVVDRLK
jgi:hypothetical protein